jgi:transcriptional regulator with XRE-family HTH domain
VPDETPYAGGLLARRLSHLFTTVLPPGKKAYTPADIANAINQAAGERITSGTYIWQLKTGRRDNPTIRLVNALARAFGVSPVYFLDEAAGQAPLPAELVTALRDDAVRDIALRSAGLSERSLDVIRATVELARERDLAEHRRAPGRPRPNPGDPGQA